MGMRETKRQPTEVQSAGSGRRAALVAHGEIPIGADRPVTRPAWKRPAAILSLTLVLTTDTAQAAKVFHGAWFTVAYPDNLIAIGSLPNVTHEGFDSAFFRDPQGRVEFYVYSPEAGGEPVDLKRQLADEKLLAETEARGSERNARWTTYAAADGSYLRSVEELRTPDLLQVRVFAVKYRTSADLAAFRADYEAFKKSFEAFPTQ